MTTSVPQLKHRLRPFRRHLRSIACFAMLLAGYYASLAQAVEAQGPTSLNFYLPYSAKSLPNLKPEIENQFASARSQTTTSQQAISNTTTINVVAYANWQDYLNAIKSGRTGLFLVPPHFAAWLIHQHDFIPLLRVEESLSYTIISRRGDIDIFTLDDLSNRQVCTQPELSLDYLMVNDLFIDNTKPPIKAVTRSIKQRLEKRDPRCHAFAVSNALIHQLEQVAPNEFIRLVQSRAWPSYAIVASNDIEARQLEILKQALRADKLTTTLFQSIEHELDDLSVVPATALDYPIELSETLYPYWQNDLPKSADQN